MAAQDEVATKDIGPWVQDALDSLEFAMGPANSTWGKVRAAMGREEPWNIPFFAIGNEVRLLQRSRGNLCRLVCVAADVKI